MMGIKKFNEIKFLIDTDDKFSYDITLKNVTCVIKDGD